MAARTDKAARPDGRHDYATDLANRRPSRGKQAANRFGRCSCLADLRQLQGKRDPPYESRPYRLGLARCPPLAFSTRYNPRHRARNQPRADRAQTSALRRAHHRLDTVGAALPGDTGIAGSEPGHHAAYGRRRTHDHLLLKPTMLRELTGALNTEFHSFELRGPRGITALAAVLSVTVAVLAAFVLHSDEPWWAAISAWMVTRSSLAAALS